MKHPLGVSTLKEAASWLSEYSGRQWSAREVLDLGFKRALADFQRDGVEAAPILWAALPPSTRFVFRRWTVERGCERRPAEWQMVPITYESAFALLSSGGSAAVEFSRASDPWSGEDGLCIDSPDTHVLVSIDMLRVYARDLVCLAAELTADTEPQPAAEPESDAEHEQRPTEQKAAPDTGGLVAWQAVMIESWPEIAKAHKGKPTPRNAMQWLKRHGPRAVIPEEQPDHIALRWLDLSGNLQTVVLKSIQSRVSEWRKARIIPPEK